MSNAFIDITKDLGLKEDNSNENPLEDVLKSFNANFFSKLQEIWVLEAKNCFKGTPIGAILADMLKSTVIYIFLLWLKA